MICQEKEKITLPGVKCKEPFQLLIDSTKMITYFSYKNYKCIKILLVQ